METRRIRRHERRRVRRTALMATSVAVLGIAVGTALPLNTVASVALVAAAAACLVAVAITRPEVAPLHGLHRVVRLPLRASVTVTLESFTSRLVGSACAAIGRRPQPATIVLDEPDDEAEAWWGETAALAMDTPWPPPLPPAPPLPAPVLAAPMPSAHVPSADAHSVGTRAGQLWKHTWRWAELLVRRDRHPTDGAGAAT